MRFIDEATIQVTAGHGGPGCISFRREKFIPRGGPNGGDGGKGGSVFFRANAQLGTLQDFRFKRIYKAPSGMHGSGSNKSGKDGDDIWIDVPVGTQIKDAETQKILADLNEHGQEWIACKGGRGGKGNAHFVSSTFQAPKFAQDGEEGETKKLMLELKLLADVALIGFPNTGKSTFISKVSAAKPKIADYAFTTLTPHLGVISLPSFSSFVIADIPGLIEGAHRGLGLGHRFLKHIERTSAFIHLLDGAQLLEEATQPGSGSFEKAIDHLVQRYQTIRNELGLFNPALLYKPEVVVLNKLDLFGADPSLLQKARNTLRERIASIRGTHPEPHEPYLISAFSGEGLEPLLYLIFSFVERSRSLSLKNELNTPPLPHDECLRN